MVKTLERQDLIETFLLLHSAAERMAQQCLKGKITTEHKLNKLENTMCTGLNVPGKIERIPQSSTLERVKNFLPALASANKELEIQINTLGPESFDIENTENVQGSIIEMNLAVVEGDSSDSDDDSVSADSDCSCDDLNCDCTKAPLYSPVNLHNLRLPKSHGIKKQSQVNSPLIEEIKQTDRNQPLEEIKQTGTNL